MFALFFLKVCGTDGVTYRTICDLKSQPNVRVDYGGIIQVYMALGT